MNQQIVPIPSGKLTRAGLENIPTLIVRAGEKAIWRFLEFFTANIRNKNTRTAYAHAVTQFFLGALSDTSRFRIFGPWQSQLISNSTPEQHQQ